MVKEKGKRLFYGAVVFCFFAASLVFSLESRELLITTLVTCAKTVVPAVFPLSVLGALIGSGVADFPLFLKRAVSAIFGVDNNGAPALLAGLFAGFPVGASGAVGLYLRGKIDKDDLCRISAFSLTPSCAFIISGVGGGMFGDVQTGIKIYLSVMISVLLTGFMTKKKKKSSGASVKTDTAPDSPSFVEALTDAVTKSAGAMVIMTAFIAFFWQMAFFLSKILYLFGSSDAAKSLILGFLEVTLGCSSASALGGDLGVLSATLFCALGGLSMQLQTAAICAPCRVRELPRRVLFLRALITLCSAAVFAVGCAIDRIY